MAFKNPVPVVVALVELGDGSLLALRRGIEPQSGKIALPGGYLNSGETVGQGLSRELLEETGLIVADDEWAVFWTGDALAANRLLLFFRCTRIVNNVYSHFV